MSGPSAQEDVRTLAFRVNDISVDDGISGTVISRDGLLYAAKMSGDSADYMNYPDCSILVFDKTGLAAMSVSVFKQTDKSKTGRILDGLSVDENGNITCVVGVSDASAGRKLYSAGAGFTVNTYGAKRSVVGGRTSLTIDEANGFVASLGDEATLLSGITRQRRYISRTTLLL